MSSITGIFYRDGRIVYAELIKTMNNKVFHRGPDDSGVWSDGSIALGHQMLWTTTESLHEKLPYHDEKCGLVITADARIDNRKELSIELDIEDMETVSDSYFILKSYEKWGQKCPEYLLGDFSFAIWDENKKTLFCARDHMGVKPFYYYLDDHMFVFGTEIKAFFAISSIPYKLNEKKLAFYLMEIEDNNSTFYEDIFCLSAAHSMTITQDKVEIRHYWQLDPEYTINMESDEEYAKTFYEIFYEAVQCRLRSAFPIGFELSGGLDSSSIVCLAKKISNNDQLLKTFSIIFNKFPECDESEYIQNVIDTGGIEPHFVCGDNIKPFDQIDKILEYQEQPFFTPNIVNLWKFYKKIQDNDVRIVLGGGGGDSVISDGNYYFRDLAVEFKWKRLIDEINAYSKNFDRSTFNVFINVVFQLIPQNFKNRLFSNKERRPGMNILNKQFANRINAKKYLESIYWDPLIKANTAKKNHYQTLSMDNIYFLEMLNRTTSVFSIESRYPFLDKRLVEFAYAIPTKIKFKNGWYRYIQRIAMENVLPKQNQWRRKGSSILPLFDKNLLELEKDRLNDIIDTKHNLINEYVDLKRVKTIYTKKLNGENIDQASMDMWIVSLLYLWLKKSRITQN